jgi:O-antigen/teichoic acid export membrane protein
VQMLIPSNLFTVLFPAFSVMSVTDKRETIQDAYLRAFKFILLAVAPITILLVFFGGGLLRVWIDEDMARNGGPPLAVLAVAVLINAPAWVTVTMGQSLGRPALVAGAQFVHLLVLIAGGLILVPHYGALGAALAWLAGNLIGIPVLVLLVNRRVLELSGARMLKDALARPLLVTALASVLAAALKPMVAGLVSLALTAAVVTLVFLALAFAVALDSRDQHTVKSFVVTRYHALFRMTPNIAEEDA